MLTPIQEQSNWIPNQTDEVIQDEHTIFRFGQRQHGERHLYSTAQTRLLVDAGLTGKKLEELLGQIGEDPPGSGCHIDYP